MMKNTFLLRHEFIEWLVTIAKFPLASAKSYCSYVAGADKSFTLFIEDTKEETNLFEYLDVLVHNGDFIDMDNTIVTIINDLSKDKIEVQLNTPLSSIKKWRSGLLQYREFLYYYIETKVDSNEIIDTDDEAEIDPFEGFNLDDREDCGTITLSFDGEIIDDVNASFNYSKNDLYKIFTFRLITQDRFYNRIFYPISFIKRVFYLKGEKQFLDNWVERLLDGVNIHLENEVIQLNNVSELDIKDSKIYVKSKGISAMAFTKLSDNKTLVPFNIKMLKKVALDHEKPLLNIMSENWDKLLTFQEISNELKKHLNGTVNRKKMNRANNQVLESDFFDVLNIENLKQEMELIASKTSLQLMDSGHNSSKGKRDDSEK
jgi:hypothetical protein